MVTLLQLEAEPYWNREIVTPELAWLGAQLCVRTGRPPTAIGTKGNTSHLDGGHRSQEWIKGSAFCDDRFYTVQAGLTATQKRHIAALDFTPGPWGTQDNRRKVIALTRQLVAAGKAGRLDGVTEVIGSFDGQHAVGTTLATGETWEADDSHLDHVHLTFDRRRLTDRAVMERVLAVALGEDDDMATSKDEWLTLMRYDGAVPTPPNWRSPNKDLALASALMEILMRAEREDQALPDLVAAGKAQTTALDQVADNLAALVALVKAGGGDPNVAALVSKLDGVASAVDGLRTELAEVRARVATALGPTT